MYNILVGILVLPATLMTRGSDRRAREDAALAALQEPMTAQESGYAIEPMSTDECF